MTFLNKNQLLQNIYMNIIREVDFWVQLLGQRVQMSGHYGSQNRTFRTFILNQFPTL